MLRSLIGNTPLIRNIDSGNFFELFLVSAVSSILLIRFFLFATGYPQIGGEGLHIAHMLWGGFIMMIAIILLLSFLNRSMYYLASVLGGVGFGTFIDELGKFITADNNYFFQPTIALIYIVFVIIYLALRPIQRLETFTKQEYLINSIKLLEEAIMLDLDTKEKRRALQLLRKSDQQNPIVQSVRAIFHELDSLPSRRIGILGKIHRYIIKAYAQLIKSEWFPEIITSFFIIQQFTAVLFSLAIIERIFDSLPIGLIPKLSFLDWGYLISSGLSILLLFGGAGFLRNNRLRAFRILKLSVLVSIFLTQFFAFYRVQFSALTLLSINIFLLAGLEYMIDREEELADD